MTTETTGLGSAGTVMAGQVPAGQEMLTGLTKATPGSHQWTLRTMHLLNWGGFTDTRVAIDSSASLVAGMSGVGKSSLLDAWTAVLMEPRGTVFNSASNDAGSTRAAGARSVLTYLRGKTDEQATGNGRPARDICLREGDGWCAVALTFTSTSGQTCTLGRVVFAPEGAVAMNETTQRWFITSTEVRLRDFEPHVQSSPPLHLTRLRHAFPEMVFKTRWDEFADQFIATLSLGRGGDGRKVLTLLHDIQRGAPIPSIDALFRTRVLERPSTFERFDRGISEFDHLVATHDELTTMADKRELLTPATSEHDRYVKAQQHARLMDGLGDVDDTRSPFALWAARTRQRVLDAALKALHAERERLKADQGVAEMAYERAKADNDTAWQLYRSCGGDRLSGLNAQRRQLLASVGQVDAARTRAAKDLDGFARLPSSEAEWEQVRDLAAQVLSDPGREKAQGDRDAALMAHGDLKRSVREAQAEVEGQSRRGPTNIPTDLDTLRTRMATAAGWAATDLPFVGELVDMAEGNDGWRRAADAVLGSFARQILVDERHRAHLSRSIDDLPLERRMRFTAAPTSPGTHHDLVSRAPKGSLAARLVVRPDSPFAVWVRDQLDTHFAHLCVELADELADDGTPRVTRTGQELRGSRGAHGGHPVPLIGYTAATRLAHLKTRLAGLEAQLADAQEVLNAAEDVLAALARRQESARAVERYMWTDLDIDAATRDLQRCDADIADMTGEDSDLPQLQERADRAQEAVNAAGARRTSLEDRAAALNSDVEKLYQARQRVDDLVRDLENDGVTLTDQQRGDLDAMLDPQDTDGEQLLSGALRRIREAVNAKRAATHTVATLAGERLTNIFREYTRRWPDTTLGTSPADYPDYEQILSRLRDEGIDDARREWADKTLTWTAQHAIHMYNEFDQAGRTITEGLEPLREVLRKVPYGAGGDRLEIIATYTPSAEVTSFTTQLRNASSNLMMALPHDDAQAIAQAEDKFATFSRVLDRVRTHTADHRDNTRARERLLDVRAHYTYCAQVVHPDGSPGATYDVFVGKSGGEGQELVAFISGAALRYRLGDDERVRPRFAPVIIDEAFIKSDSLTCHRGITALRTLGFQPVVVAPDNTVQALEPHMDKLFLVTKNPTGYSHVQTIDKDDLHDSWIDDPDDERPGTTETPHPAPPDTYRLTSPDDGHHREVESFSC